MDNQINIAQNKANLLPKSSLVCLLGHSLVESGLAWNLQSAGCSRKFDGQVEIVLGQSSGPITLRDPMISSPKKISLILSETSPKSEIPTNNTFPIFPSSSFSIISSSFSLFHSHHNLSSNLNPNLFHLANNRSTDNSSSDSLSSHTSSSNDSGSDSHSDSHLSDGCFDDDLLGNALSIDIPGSYSDSNPLISDFLGTSSRTTSFATVEEPRIRITDMVKCETVFGA